VGSVRVALGIRKEECTRRRWSCIVPCVVDVLEQHRGRHETCEVHGVCSPQGRGCGEGVDEEQGATMHAVAWAVKNLEARRRVEVPVHAVLADQRAQG
jgi:hypothetical protein